MIYCWNPDDIKELRKQGMMPVDCTCKPARMWDSDEVEYGPEWKIVAVNTETGWIRGLQWTECGGFVTHSETGEVLRYEKTLPAPLKVVFQ